MRRAKRTTSTSRWKRWAACVVGLSLSLFMVGCPDDGGDGGPDDGMEDAGSDVQMDSMLDGGGDVDQNRSGLSIRVLSHEGDPIEGADVEIGEETLQTDAQGYIDLEVDAGSVLARASADGYANGTAVIDVPADTSVERAIRLLASGEPHEFDASDDSELYEERVRLSIPGGSLEDADGNDYSGMAQAHITPLNPSTDESSAYPGPLEGILEGDSEPTPMESIFMADIELESDSGEALSLKDGSSATLEFVLPDDLQDDYSTGDQIEAYWYNENEGYWEQDGTGDVIESTYAAEKLAWQVEVDHFTWWNCDAPWTDKNCVNVDVVEEGTGDPVPGAQVYVDGQTYNGTTTGSSGASGEACVNFKLGSDVAVTASAPGMSQVGNATAISGSSTAATCAGQGSGSCQQIQIEMAPPTCASGRILDSAGGGLQGATVTAYYDGANGTESVQAQTDANGEYCLPVPQEAEADIVASYVDSGTFKSATTSITAGGSAQSCGGGSCTSVSDLTPEAGQDGCINGDVRVDTNSGLRDAAPGTHVYVFGEGQGAADEVDINCDVPPEDWGTLLSETSTDANGDFCLSAPVAAGDVTVVVGKCRLGSNPDVPACITQRGTTITQAGACGDSSCVDLVEPVYLRDVCGEGP